MPRALDKNKHEMLLRYWNEGMTSAAGGSTELIQKAAEEVGVDFRLVKNWIGNERKRRGEASKRGPQVKRTEEFIPCKRRKKSGFNVFKSKFLSSKGRDLQNTGKNMAEIQKIANDEYRKLTKQEKQEFAEDAEIQNVNPGEKMINKAAVIKRLRGDLHDIIGRLDSLGCPSVWIGYISGSPEKVFSPGMAFLGDDPTFNDYVTSALINKLAKDRMQKTTAEIQATHVPKEDSSEETDERKDKDIKRRKRSRRKDLPEQEEEQFDDAQEEETDECQDDEDTEKQPEQPQQHVLFHQLELHQQNGEAAAAAAQIIQSPGTRQVAVYNAADGQQFAILLQEQQDTVQTHMNVGEVLLEMQTQNNQITTTPTTQQITIPITTT